VEEDGERLGVGDSNLDSLIDVHDLERKGLTPLIHRLPICLIILGLLREQINLLLPVI
jgi:hypothetical protein